MLDQNTDRMWYVIGAVIVGAALILLMNGTFPELFASVGETFKGKVEETSEVVDSIGGVPKSIVFPTDGASPAVPRPNLLPNSGGEALHDVELYYAADIVEEDGKMAIAFKSKGGIAHFWSSGVYLEEGETYTFSFYAQGSRNMTLSNFIYINKQNVIKQSTDGTVVDGSPVTTEWQRHSVTFVAKGNENVSVHMYPTKMNADGTTDLFYLTEWKLEKGDTATPWVL